MFWLSLHLLKRHIVRNHGSYILNFEEIKFKWVLEFK